MKIAFEWDKDHHGRDILIARKVRGKISISEIQEAMMGDYRYIGGWAVIFKAQEDSGYQGWGGGEEPKGDMLQLYQIYDDGDCPVCAATFCGIEYCQHCGERIKTEEGEPT